MNQSGSFRDELVERLRATAESRGFSIYRVEKELARGRGYVGDALRGDKKLSVEVILEVLEVVGAKPEDFFGQTIRSGASDELPVRRRGRRRKNAPLPPSPRTASTLLQAVLVVLARRGVLSLDEVEQAERELSR